MANETKKRGRGPEEEGHVEYITNLVATKQVDVRYHNSYALASCPTVLMLG